MKQSLLMPGLQICDLYETLHLAELPLVPDAELQAAGSLKPQGNAPILGRSRNRRFLQGMGLVREIEDVEHDNEPASTQGEIPVDAHIGRGRIHGPGSGGGPARTGSALLSQHAYHSLIEAFDGQVTPEGRPVLIADNQGTSHFPGELGGNPEPAKSAPVEIRAALGKNRFIGIIEDPLVRICIVLSCIRAWSR